jgi:hypothetical protein
MSSKMSLIVEYASSLLKLSAAIVLFSLLFKFPYVLMVSILFCCACAIFLTFYRAVSIFQIRIQEVLLSLLLSSLISTSAFLFVKTLHIERHENYLTLIVAIVVLPLIFVSLGAAWGLNKATRMKMTDSPRRLKLLIWGWLMVMSFFSCIIVLIMTYSLASGKVSTNELNVFKYFYMGAIVGSFVGIPGLRIELRCRNAHQDQ